MDSIFYNRPYLHFHCLLLRNNCAFTGGPSASRDNRVLWGEAVRHAVQLSGDRQISIKRMFILDKTLFGG